MTWSPLYVYIEREKIQHNFMMFGTYYEMWQSIFKHRKWCRVTIRLQIYIHGFLIVFYFFVFQTMSTRLRNTLLLKQSDVIIMILTNIAVLKLLYQFYIIGTRFKIQILRHNSVWSYDIMQTIGEKISKETFRSSWQLLRLNWTMSKIQNANWILDSSIWRVMINSFKVHE